MPVEPPADTRPVRDGLALGLAVGVVGVVFGVLATTSGLSVGKACALSLLVFTGASQFAATSVIADGGSIAAALGSGLLLGARNTLYGPVVARWFRAEPLMVRLGVAHIVLDESTGNGAAQPDAASPPHRAARAGFVAAGLAVYLGWNLGTLLGALTGEALGQAETWGLDAAFPAAFVALLAPQLRHRPARLTAAMAAGLAVVTVPVLPAGAPILVAALGAVPAAWLRHGDEAAVSEP